MYPFSASQCINLSYCPNVHTICLRDILLNHPPEITRPSLAAAILSNVTSTRMEEVSFSFKLDTSSGFTSMDSFDWDGAAWVLQQPQFANLRRVIIHLWSYAGSERLAREICQGSFSSFNSRGLLQLHAHRLTVIPRDGTGRPVE